MSFEAVGVESVLKTCIDGVKSGREIVMIVKSMTTTVAFEMNKVVLKEIHLKGSVSCTCKEFTETIYLIASSMIIPEKYVTNLLPLEQL